AVGRDHTVARVEVSPFEVHRFAVGASGQPGRGGLDDDMRAVSLDRRQCAAVANGFGSRVLVWLIVGAEPQPVQKIEGDHIDAVDRSGDEILAGLLDSAREELERIANAVDPGYAGSPLENRRPSVRAVSSISSDRQRSRT